MGQIAMANEMKKMRKKAEAKQKELQEKKEFEEKKAEAINPSSWTKAGYNFAEPTATSSSSMKNPYLP